MIVDLCRENLTQRDNEFRMELDAVLLCKKWIEGRIVQTPDSSKQTHKKEVGAREIAIFLSKEGKAIGKSKVSELLKIHESLDPEIRKRVRGFHAGRKGNSLLSQFFLPLPSEPGR